MPSSKPLGSTGGDHSVRTSKFIPGRTGAGERAANGPPVRVAENDPHAADHSV
jgi:hypothetical protein